MNVFLIAWLCTSASMDDCQVYGVASWEGATAPAECIIEKPAERERLAQLGYEFVGLSRCLDENDNEIKRASL